MTNKIGIMLVAIFTVISGFSQVVKVKHQNICVFDQTPTRVQTDINPGYKKIGTLKPKSINEIETSMWSLGCETLDRDLACWNNYKNYIEPLGIKHIRLQGGWGKTEKEKGVYNFAWLDSIVDDALSSRLKVCIETSYGNRLYEKDAALGPGGKIPEGEETLTAWDSWVKAMVYRYSAKGVSDWMMYNEPDLNKENSVEEIVSFNIRTAEIIKGVDPKARIGGLVASNLNLELIENFLKLLKDRGKVNLFYWLIYHGYGANPDVVYNNFEQLKRLVKSYAPHLKLWQGEAGCASEEVQYALAGIEWSEFSQAKWNARRMLGDIGHGMKSSIFSISDLSYEKDFISRYGLLKTNPDNSIIKVKSAYYTVQNIVSVFNDTIELIPNSDKCITCNKKLSNYAFKDKKSGLGLLVFWDGANIPSNNCEMTKASFTVKKVKITDPVWVDLITGNIFDVPSTQMLVNGDEYTFKDVPVYDSPSVIIDKSLLTFLPSRQKK